MIAVYVGGGEPLESVLDMGQVAMIAKRVPLDQEYLDGMACSLEPVATLAEFTSCLRHASQVTPTATDMNTAAPFPLEIYADDLKSYAAVRELKWPRAEVPRESGTRM